MPEPIATVAAQVHAAHLLPALEQLRGRADVLSLDCFDTLLWRKAALPTDVFYDAARSEAWMRAGVRAETRWNGEAYARRLKKLESGTHEVGMEEILAACAPHAGAEELAALIEAELRAEEEHLYPFAPLCELVRAARAQGLRVILVSDTYFSEARLRRLLRRALPADVFAALEKIFVSSEHGCAKAGGLLEKALAFLRVPASRVVHLGDNPHADLHPPRALGMHALHLVQLDPQSMQLERLRAQAAAVQLPELRRDRSLKSLFKPLLAARAGTPTAANLIGGAALGAILAAFRGELRAAIERQRGEGSPVGLRFEGVAGPLLARLCADVSHSGESSSGGPRQDWRVQLEPLAPGARGSSLLESGDAAIDATLALALPLLAGLLAPAAGGVLEELQQAALQFALDSEKLYAAPPAAEDLRGERIAGITRMSAFPAAWEQPLRAGLGLGSAPRGLERELSELLSRRYQFVLEPRDHSLRRETLRGLDGAPHQAFLEPDGCFALTLPLEEAAKGISLGGYRWLQLHSLRALEPATGGSIDLMPEARLLQGAERAPGLIECADESCALFPTPPEGSGAEWLCELRFQPIRERTEAAQEAGFARAASGR